MRSVEKSEKVASTPPIAHDTTREDMNALYTPLTRISVVGVRAVMQSNSQNHVLL